MSASTASRGLTSGRIAGGKPQSMGIASIGARSSAQLKHTRPFNACDSMAVSPALLILPLNRYMKEALGEKDLFSPAKMRMSFHAQERFQHSTVYRDVPQSTLRAKVPDRSRGELVHRLVCGKSDRRFDPCALGRFQFRCPEQKERLVFPKRLHAALLILREACTWWRSQAKSRAAG